MNFSDMNHWQQLALATAICERSFPNFQLFWELEEQPQQVKNGRKILNKVWEYLRGQLKSHKNMENQLELVNQLIPDPDHYPQYGAYPALDTGVNLQSCVQCILDTSIEDAQAMVEMSQARLAEVLELQDIKQADSELWARHQTFLQQAYDLIGKNQSHAQTIKELIPLSKDQGISHLGVSLEE